MALPSRRVAAVAVLLAVVALVGTTVVARFQPQAVFDARGVAAILVAAFGPILDAQSVRLENARERLSGVHPDYWLYVTELRGIRERVGDVVAEARRAAQ